MKLEEKFQNYINTAQKNYDFTISPSVLIHDFAEIAEKYYAINTDNLKNTITIWAGNINDQDEGITFDDIDKLVDAIGGSK